MKVIQTVVTVVFTLSVGTSLCAAQAKAKSSPGEPIFKANCVLCHGVDGRANTPLAKQLGAPDLTTAKVQSQPDAVLKQIITDGKNNMPPFKDQLSPEDIGNVLSYVRTLGKAKKSGAK